MDIFHLLKELERREVPKRYYSINGDLSSDIHVLNQLYGKWEYFYFDEKGNRNNYHTFDNENDACEYLLKILVSEMGY
jgi:hypothetical protein